MHENFFHKIKVYYEDTDASGRVYHANYLKFFDKKGETQKFKRKGTPQEASQTLPRHSKIDFSSQHGPPEPQKTIKTYWKNNSFEPLH